MYGVRSTVCTFVLRRACIHTYLHGVLRTCKLGTVRCSVIRTKYLRTATRADNPLAQVGGWASRSPRLRSSSRHYQGPKELLVFCPLPHCHCRALERRSHQNCAQTTGLLPALYRVPLPNRVRGTSSTQLYQVPSTDTLLTTPSLPLLSSLYKQNTDCFSPSKKKNYIVYCCYLYSSLPSSSTSTCTTIAFCQHLCPTTILGLSGSTAISRTTILLHTTTEYSCSYIIVFFVHNSCTHTHARTAAFFGRSLRRSTLFDCGVLFLSLASFAAQPRSYSKQFGPGVLEHGSIFSKTLDRPFSPRHRPIRSSLSAPSSSEQALTTL